MVAARRPVLGELGNKVLRNASQDLLGKGVEKGAALKNANPTLKNIKPRVDTRWRKADTAAAAVVVPKKVVTRSDSQKVAVEPKPSANADAVKVHVQLNKGNEVKHVALKREDSQLSLRTLAKQNRKAQPKSAPSSGTSSSDEHEIVSISKVRIRKYGKSKVNEI